VARSELRRAPELRAIGNDQYFEKAQGRGDDLDLPCIGRSEDGRDQLELVEALLDPVEEGGGVERGGTLADVRDQSHDRRSTST
jgi:hypothetical protein